jgi:predicted DNA-binding protein
MKQNKLPKELKPKLHNLAMSMGEKKTLNLKGMISVKLLQDII